MLTVQGPGADLEQRVAAQRDGAVRGRASTRSTSTCRWRRRRRRWPPITSRPSGVFYSGIFPNTRADGDVLRMQSLNRVTVRAGDVAVVSEHGRELLDYVLADLEATHGSG